MCKGWGRTSYLQLAMLTLYRVSFFACKPCLVDRSWRRTLESNQELVDHPRMPPREASAAVFSDFESGDPPVGSWSGNVRSFRVRGLVCCTLAWMASALSD